MSYCTPCPPCDSEFPLLCEPLETTANGKRLVVEDSAACQKTIQSPVAQQVLKTDGAGNLTWTNGANSTVLGKDSTGKVEFATLNSVLQSGPVDLGSQPLTTTGALTVGSLSPTLAITASSLTVSGATSTGSLVVSGVTSTAAITSSSTILANGNSSKIGYNTGAGGTITQGAGAKTNSVTLNRPTGIIVTDNAALAGDTAVTFNLSNSVIEATDIVVVSHISGGTLGSYNFAVAPAAGNANIVIRNITTGSLSEALTLRFIVIKSVNA
jgi:hypothetical protein